jgi:hypothetical protein
VTVETLYFDESGYTGYNLLDPAQPMFAIASTDVSPNDAETILRESFPKYGGSEYKFTNIWRSNNRKGLIEFGGRLAPLGERAFSWMMDKQFVVLTKIVDFLIEPFVTNAGYDFYADGFCWKCWAQISSPNMVASVAHWRRTYADDLEVVHDATANFFRCRETWERMTNADVPRQLLSRGDGTTVVDAAPGSIVGDLHGRAEARNAAEHFRVREPDGPRLGRRPSNCPQSPDACGRRRRGSATR